MKKNNQKARKGKVGIQQGQIWAIGKMVKESIENDLNVKIGDTVKVINAFVGDSLVKVSDRKTGKEFELKSIHLGKFLYS